MSYATAVRNNVNGLRDMKLYLFVADTSEPCRIEYEITVGPGRPAYLHPIMLFFMASATRMGVCAAAM